jgi:hypothetical protein
MFARKHADVIFSTYEKPKHYDYIPETFKLRWDQPEKFLPDYLINTFNQKLFNNFLHRECFNSCVTNSNSLTDEEQACYKNCQSKHLYSMGVFKDILMTRRKWRGFRNYINIKEYSRTPEEMGTDAPTDPLRRKEYLKYNQWVKDKDAKYGLPKLFDNDKFNVEAKNIFDFYLEGRYTTDSNVDKDKRKDFYNEYKELTEVYGDKVNELLKGKINLKDWKNIPGEDFAPEDANDVAGGDAE